MSYLVDLRLCGKGIIIALYMDYKLWSQSWNPLVFAIKEAMTGYSEGVKGVGSADTAI